MQWSALEFTRQTFNVQGQLLRRHWGWVLPSVLQMHDKGASCWGRPARRCWL